MGWWRTLLGKKPATRPVGDANLLVISDVHLGEDIVIDGPESLGDYIRTLNRELADFVGAHRRARVNERPWHLVINGDLFDFVKVSLRPEPHEAFLLWSRQQIDLKETLSIPNTAENVVWKLERIIEIHRPLFRELALFVLDGNRLTFIEGNHDAEFYFEEVRKTLVASLSRLAEQSIRQEHRQGAWDAADFETRIAFREWFAAEPGLYHIEHGHQYDEYCSFEYHLAPLDRKDGLTLATPISHRAAPYFAKHVAELTHRGFDKMGLWALIRFAIARGPRIVWEMTGAYWAMIFDLMGQVGPKRHRALAALAESHQARLRSMADESPYGFSTLDALDRLTATPAEYSRLKMYHGGYLDRFIVGSAIVLGLIPGLLMSWHWALLWSLGVLVTGFLVLRGIAWACRSDLDAALRAAAARIAEITGVRYVVFGHSHHPGLVDLRLVGNVGRFGERAYYLNSGSWVTREILLGEEGAGMTYVEITGRGAALKRWVSKQRAAVCLAATFEPAPAASAKPISREEDAVAKRPSHVE